MTTDIIPVQTDDALSRGVQKSLVSLESILDIPNPSRSDDDYLDIMKLKKDVSAILLHSGLKADENRFRRENKDIIEKLFEKIHKKTKLIDGKVVREV